MVDNCIFGVWAIAINSCGWVSIPRNIPSLKATYASAVIAMARFIKLDTHYKYSIRRHKENCSGEYDFDNNVSCCEPVEASKEELINLIKTLEL